MSILGNDLVNTIQSDRRDYATRERLAHSARTARAQVETSTSFARRAFARWTRLSMPTWARLVLARAR